MQPKAKQHEAICIGRNKNAYNINLRNKDGKLVIKDILDIDFDMKVKQYGEHYSILINKQYILDELFDNEEDAENKMYDIASNRNALEESLRGW